MKIGDIVRVVPMVRLSNSDIYEAMPADAEGTILRARGVDNYGSIFEWTVYFPDAGGEWYFDERELEMIEGGGDDGIYQGR